MTSSPPLLAHLFHRALHWQHQQGQVLDGAAALAQAKVQLRSGRWHPEHLQGEEARACEQEIADSLRKAYAVPLTNLLQAAVAGHEAEIWKDKLEVRVVQGLLDSAPDEEDFIPLKSDPLKPDTHLAWRLAQDLAEEQDQPGEGQLQHKAAHRLMNVIYEHRARLHCIGGGAKPDRGHAGLWGCTRVQTARNQQQAQRVEQTAANSNSSD
jgi:hypothetical protein